MIHCFITLLNHIYVCSASFSLGYSVAATFFNQMFDILYDSNTNILFETISEEVNSHKEKKGKMCPHSWLSLEKSAPALTFAIGKVKQSSTSSKSTPVCGYCQMSCSGAL